MKIWTNNQFAGHWPVGTAAVVVAPTARDAALILSAELEKIGLHGAKEEDMKELPFADGEVRILCDGDY